VDPAATGNESAVRVVDHDPDLGAAAGTGAVLYADVDRVHAGVWERVVGLEVLAARRQRARAVSGAVVPVDRVRPGAVVRIGEVRFERDRSGALGVRRAERRRVDVRGRRVVPDGRIPRDLVVDNGRRLIAVAGRVGGFVCADVDDDVAGGRHSVDLD